MAGRSDDLRKQLNEFWRQAIDQLEEVKEAISRSTGKIEDRLEADMQRLRLERDRLLKRLGEQTYKLVNQGKVRMPEVVKRTVDRLNDVIDGMVVKQSKKKVTKKKPATGRKKKTTKKKSSAKTAKTRSRKVTAAKA